MHAHNRGDMQIAREQLSPHVLAKVRTRCCRRPPTASRHHVIIGVIIINIPTLRRCRESQQINRTSKHDRYAGAASELVVGVAAREAALHIYVSNMDRSWRAYDALKLSAASFGCLMQLPLGLSREGVKE